MGDGRERKRNVEWRCTDGWMDGEGGRGREREGEGGRGREREEEGLWDGDAGREGEREGEGATEGSYKGLMIG